jgi:hypothetical protein
MAKNKISEWSSTAASNTDIGGIDIAEGCAPSGINNAIRELMAQVKDQQAGTDADNFTVGGNLSVTGTSTLTGAVTATAGVTGNLTGDVTGDVTGNVTGDVTGTAANVTGTVAVANGGTGVTTSTGTGSVVLSNSPTLVTPALGTPSAIVLTNATGTANSLNAGIGVNQTWQNVTSSRAKDTDYTNSTGKPIFVSGRSDDFTSSTTITCTVDGVTVFQRKASPAGSSENIAFTFIVPNSSVYRVSGDDIGYWAELR